MDSRISCLFLFAIAAFAQDPFASHSMSGLTTSSSPGLDRISSQPLSGVVTPAPAGIDRLTVEISALGERAPAIQTPVRFDGTFEFRQIPAGTYEVRLKGVNGEVLVKVYSSVPSGSDLELRLPATVRAAAPVSVYRLTHKVPSKAQKLLKKAAKAHDQRDFEATLRHLDAALAVDPDYADALHLRGIAQLRAGNYPEARAALARAASLDDANPAILSAAAAAALLTGDPNEAARLAKATLRLHPDNPTATIVLSKLRPARRQAGALSLAGQN